MKSKTITIALIAGLVAVAAAFGVRFFTEAQRTAAFPYIRPEAGLAYTEFANTVTVDSPAAKAALATAERAAPGNAFHDYLAAVSSAVNEDFPAATSALEAGRRKNEIAVFTTEPMPAPMEAVPTLRKLVVRPADLKHLSDEEAVAYLTAVREAGLHMTQVDPIDALAAIHVVAVVKGATSNLVALAEARKIDASEYAAMLAELEAWEESFKQTVKPENAILKVAKASGVDEKIVSDYMARVEIRDRAIVAKIEKANDEVYLKELEAVRTVLGTMPGARQTAAAPQG